MIAHGDNFARAIKHGAGIVATFFNVGRKRRAAQCRAHFFRNGMKQTFKDFQFNRVAHGRLV
jgi:hypothetical protein